MRWRADPPEARLELPRDGVSFVYHRPSGMTHVVAPPVPEILAALASGPCDAAGLIARLPADWALDVRAIPLIEARLAELAASGLVAPA